MTTGENRKFGKLVGAIDEGTSSARFILFRAETCEVICYHQKELQQKYPQNGWVEQDPKEILSVVRECIDKTVEKLINLGGKKEVNTMLVIRSKFNDRRLSVMFFTFRHFLY